MAPPLLEIERDLVRWSRGRWIFAISSALLLQATALFLTRQSAPPPVAVSHEPAVSFIQESFPAEPLALEDSTLFAGANPRGFSGQAWMIHPSALWTDEESLPPPKFLTLREARRAQPEIAPAQFTVFRHSRPPPQPMEGAPLQQENRTASVLESKGGRQIISAPSLPVQFATDAVRPTGVEVLIDPDGAVFSARLEASSGSKTADNDALNIAKKIHFTPSPDAQDFTPMAPGSLIFHWKALAPGPVQPPVR